MTCPKLLLALMAAAVQTAPQISRSRPSSSFSAPSTFGGSTFSTPSSFGNSFSAPSSFGNSASRPNVGSYRQPFRVEENYGPASYNFDYKVADDVAQTYISQSESRDGNAVTGNYNYVDPNGSLVTVNYRADEGGFKQERTVQEGAVNIRNTPFQNVVSRPTNNFVSQPTNKFISRPTNNFVSRPTNNFVSRPTNNFVSRPTNNFVSRPTNNFVSRPTNNFVSRPTNNFVSRPTNNFVSRPTTNFDTSGQGHLFNSRPAGGFSTTGGSSFPTIRG